MHWLASRVGSLWHVTDTKGRCLLWLEKMTGLFTLQWYNENKQANKPTCVVALASVLLCVEAGRLGASPAASAWERGSFHWLLFQLLWGASSAPDISQWDCLFLSICSFHNQKRQNKAFFVLLNRKIFASQLLLMYWSSWGQTVLVGSQKQEENENPSYIFQDITVLKKIGVD